MSSYYFDAQPHTALLMDDIGGPYFQTLFNIKNYDGEIELFLSWIEPYIDAIPGDFIGYWRYEEVTVPTLIYYKETTDDPAPRVVA